MTDTVTSAIELAVGVASLAMAWPSWQRGSWFRTVAGLLAVAGIAAIVHAVWRFVEPGFGG